MATTPVMTTPKNNLGSSPKISRCFSTMSPAFLGEQDDEGTRQERTGSKGDHLSLYARRVRNVSMADVGSNGPGEEHDRNEVANKSKDQQSAPSVGALDKQQVLKERGFEGHHHN